MEVGKLSVDFEQLQTYTDWLHKETLRQLLLNMAKEEVISMTMHWCTSPVLDFWTDFKSVHMHEENLTQTKNLKISCRNCHYSEEYPGQVKTNETDLASTWCLQTPGPSHQTWRRWRGRQTEDFTEVCRERRQFWFGRMMFLFPLGGNAEFLGSSERYKIKVWDNLIEIKVEVWTTYYILCMWISCRAGTLMGH